MRNRFHPYLFTALAATILLAASCAGIHRKAHDPVKGLEHNVIEHWQAKQDMNLERAYTWFCKTDPDFTLADYIQSTNVQVNSFAIESIEYADNKKQAAVAVRFDATIHGFTAKGMQLKETWRMENNRWCLTPPEGIGGLFSR